MDLFRRSDLGPEMPIKEGSPLAEVVGETLLGVYIFQYTFWLDFGDRVVLTLVTPPSDRGDFLCVSWVITKSELPEWPPPASTRLSNMETVEGYSLTAVRGVSPNFTIAFMFGSDRAFVLRKLDLSLGVLIQESPETSVFGGIDKNQGSGYGNVN
jgi:hypothetical protein